MKEKINPKCITCLYVIILSLTAIISSFVLPNFDRTLVRGITGILTIGGSLIGISLCARFVYLMARANSELADRLKEVYFLMFVIFLCTSFFGVFGIIHPPVAAWDIVYNIRAVALLLEVLALIRFLKAWVKVGKTQ